MCLQHIRSHRPSNTDNLGRDGVFATPRENQGRMKSKVCQFRPNPKFHSMKALSRYITWRSRTRTHTTAERDTLLHKTDGRQVGRRGAACACACVHRVSAVSAQQSTTWVRFRSADLCLFIVILLHLLQPKRSFSLRSVTFFVVDVIFGGGGGLH